MKGTTMRYIIVIETGRGNHAASAPDVPGCIATARSVPSVIREMKTALEWHMESLQEHGDPIPEPRTQTASEAAAALPGDLIATVEVELPVRA